MNDTAQSAVYAIIGAAGAQGLECISLISSADPGARILALDLNGAPQRAGPLAAKASWHRLDVLEQTDRLVKLLADCDVVINVAGPFFKLGPAVLKAALEAETDYVDICDDVDATEALLDLDTQASDTGVVAVTGIGSAPGTTNLLVKLAQQYLADKAGAVDATISWSAPGQTLTPAIFGHLLHCFKTAIPGRTEVPQWDELAPRIEKFPEPMGALPTVRLGHPEPLTVKRFLGIECELRGGVTTPGAMHRAWELAREHANGLGADVAWDRMRAFLAKQAETDTCKHSGMLIRVSDVDGTGVQFESATTISMEQSTAVPAVTCALMLREDKSFEAGVWGPEVLDPASFFGMSNRVSPGGGNLAAYRLDQGTKSRISVGSLFAK